MTALLPSIHAFLWAHFEAACAARGVHPVVVERVMMRRNTGREWGWGFTILATSDAPPEIVFVSELIVNLSQDLTATFADALEVGERIDREKVVQS